MGCFAVFYKYAQRAQAPLEFDDLSLHGDGHRHARARLSLDHVPPQLQPHAKTLIKTYFSITKPGILFGNSITAIGGFALVSKGHLDPWLFLAMLAGLSLIMASGCVFNNYIDRIADEKMGRTKKRALAQRSIPLKNALIFAVLLGLSGTFTLASYTNILTVSIALAGFFVYVVAYSIWKYRTEHATLIGSVAGAVPPVVGYCAVSNSFDLGAFILFMIVVLWQMPHFFAIAIYRQHEYAAASIPVLPIKRGIHVTKVQMVLYLVAFIAAAFALTLFGYTGYAYLAVAALLGAAWLWFCIKGFKAQNDKLWARKMFLSSLVVIITLSLMISLDAVK